MDLSKKLNENHYFTVGWLLDSLRENDSEFIKLHKNHIVKDVTASDISEGKGFVSIVLRCIITFLDNQDTYTTILKIPGFSSMQDATEKSDYDNSWLSEEVKNSLYDLHDFECKFYTEIAPTLEAPIPKVFKTVPWIKNERDGCVHMEDLTNSGKSLSYFDGINLSQVKSFVRHLARMHKSILGADPELWKGKHLKGSDCFGEALEMIEATLEPFLKKSKREDEFRAIIEKYKNMATSKEYYNYAIRQCYIDLEMPSVLVHGDPHSGNLLWSLDAEGDVGNEISAIIDWQTMHEGSPMEDLARFLTHCTSGVVRRQAEAFIFDYYLECLTKEFEGDARKVPYSVDQLKKAYYFAFVIQTFFTVSDLTFFLAAMDEKDEGIKQAYLDYGYLKAFHNLEDMDRFLQGELKEYFENFGKKFANF